MDPDRNLLFGVLALQADLLDPARFAEACSAWAARKNMPLADLLVERGWLTPADRADVDKLLDRKLQKHGGDAKASLAEVTNDRVRQSLAGVADPDLRQSLAGPTPPPQGHALVYTTDYIPQARERYTLSRLHATGGIGRVWLARDDALGRDVALKELRPERAGNPVVWARFHREAQITSQLEHPGIVPIYEVGRRPDDQAPFYTMRFVRGRTLAEAAASYHQKRAQGKAGPLELRELLSAFVGVCNAVAYAHSRGVLHRDLKPQNVVLGDYGEVIVLDWGLARLLSEVEVDAGPPPVAVGAEGDAPATVQGQVLGTPRYMAPEQAEGRLDQIGPATDVYGLGAILYEILTGRAPFTGTELTAVLRQVIHDRPAPPRLVAGAPAALEAVCLKALAKKAARRYRSAKELAGEVQHWLADEPVSGYREPALVTLGRWARRHRGLMAGLTAALLAGVVGLGIVSALQEQVNRELAAKNGELSQARWRAERREQLALQAIDHFEQAVQNNLDVQNRPELEPLRHKLLEAPLRFYRAFRADPQTQTDTRPEALKQLGRAVFRLAYLTAEIGSETQAVQAYREAIDILEPLVRGQPEVAWNQTALATAYNNLGNLYKKAGKPAEARAAYERSLALRDNLVRTHPENAAYLSDLGQTYHNLGWFLESLGESLEALASYREAIAHRELAFGKDAKGFGTELARSHNNLGTLQASLGHRDEARRTHERARAILEPLVGAQPQESRYRDELAKAYQGLGGLAEGDEALAHHERARQLKEALVQERSAVTQWRVSLASSYRDLGSLHGKAQRFAEALASLRKAGDLLEGIVREHPEVASYRCDLANSLNHLGLLLSDCGRATEALAQHERARALVEGVLRENPDHLEARSLLGRTWNTYGWALAKLGRHEEAVAAYGQAIEHERVALAKASPVYQYRHWQSEHYANLGKSLRALGRLAEAEKTSDERVQLWVGHAEEAGGRYDEVCHLALLAAAVGQGKEELTMQEQAQRQRLADRALAALHLCVRLGYRNLQRLKTDPELQVLRSRADFQELMNELESKEKQGDREPASGDGRPRKQVTRAVALLCRDWDEAA